MTLCADCKQARLIETKRGPVYVYCTLSEGEPAYPKYPAQPVVECAGYHSATASDPKLS